MNMEPKIDNTEKQRQFQSQVAEDGKHVGEDTRGEKSRIKYLKRRVRPDMHNVTFEPEEIREMLQMIREDTKQCKKHVFEEKTQTKWIRFQTEKRKRKLDKKLEKILTENDQLEILKIKLDQQNRETEKKWKEILALILNTEKIKASIEKSAEDVRKTNEVMLKTQTKIKKSNEELKTYMVSVVFVFFALSNKRRNVKDKGFF